MAFLKSQNERMTQMEIVLFWFGLSLVLWVAANRRGRCGFCWFIFSLILSPILLGLLLFALPPNYVGQIHITE